MPAARLEDRAVLAIAGPETRGFLQGLITNDVERLKPGEGIYAALLTPQGKILFDFLLSEGDGAVLLDCAAACRDALARRLSMYRLRAKVTIEPREGLSVVAAWDEGALPGSFADPRLPGLGRRGVMATAEVPAHFAGSAVYHSHRMALGVPESSDFGSDRMFALDADLDELNAVDFTKGCYVGQELTARMKHRATSRKRLLPFDAAMPVEAGTTVRAGDKDIGEITAMHDGRGFALIRLDRLDEAGSAPVNAGSSPLILIKPSWLFA
ncbi:MAG: folate-binding protein YgfZ [Proteobacteria bacterium]|nr:folate-binding protein YgfZ [Pseudomonadota bacterium]